MKKLLRQIRLALCFGAVFAGVELPEGFEPDGQSAVAAFKGEAFTRTKPIFWEWKGGISKDDTWPTDGFGKRSCRRIGQRIAS